MGDTTGIGWTDSTFNPWIGCEKVSPACAHCYAEQLVTGRMGQGDRWGADGTRRIAAESTWRKPVAWERDHQEFEDEHGHRRRVFCASLADVFEPRPEVEEARERLLELIQETPHLDWQLLTKRPEIALERFRAGGWELTENLWLGVSVENARFTWRADVLRGIPAAIRFISAEPLLGSLFLERDDAHGIIECDCECVHPETHLICLECGQDEPDCECRTRKPLVLDGIDWVIVGGESGGRKSRPTDPRWVREIRDACAARSIAFFFKQWGSWVPSGRAFMFAGNSPKSGGKSLDGHEHCAIPDLSLPSRA